MKQNNDSKIRIISFECGLLQDSDDALAIIIRNLDFNPELPGNKEFLHRKLREFANALRSHVDPTHVDSLADQN